MEFTGGTAKMQILVDNCIRVRGAPGPIIAAITKALTMDNPDYVERKKRRWGTWGIPATLQLYSRSGNDFVIPRGFLGELEAILMRHSFNPTITYSTVEGLAASFGPWNPDFTLESDQQEATLAVLQGGNGVLVAPAGSGKTVMGMYVVYMRGRCTLWLTHTTDLMYQSAERAKAAMLGVGEVGLLGDGKQQWGSGKLIIATVQTLGENPQLVEALKPIVGTLVIDEAHHFPAPAFVDVAGQFPAQYMLGLTATPERKDKLERYLYVGVGPKLYEISRDDLYTTGRLIKPEIKFVYTNYGKDSASDLDEELNNVDTGGEELDYTAELQALMDDEARLELIARNVIEMAFKNYSLVICESVRYCYKLRDKVAEIFQRELSAYPPRMAVVHGGLSRWAWQVAKNEKVALAAVAAGEARRHKYDPKAKRWKIEVAKYTEDEMEAWQVTSTQRREIMNRAANREIAILFATQLAREGLDFPHLNVLHLATPKRGDANEKGRTDGANVEQEVGRVQRPDRQNPGKKAYVIDYVDYNVGIFRAQYHSRRRVYARLGLKVPPKPRTKKDDIEEFLANMTY